VATAVLVLLGLATVAAVVGSEGSLAVALAPLLGAALLYAVWRLPLRYSALGLLLIVLCVDNPYEIPFAGMWAWPLEGLARLLYDNLYRTVGLGFLRFPLLFVLMAGLWGLGVFRRFKRTRVDSDVVQLPRPLRDALWLCMGTVLFLEVMGVARQGDMQQSLWQVQHLLFLPVLCGLWALASRGPRDHAAVAWVVLGSAVFKVALGAYFLYFIARPQGVIPPYVTQHTDTILFVMAIVIVVALWMERPSLRHTAGVLLISPVMLFGIVINDRRLAYVSLAACLLTIFLLSPWNRSKRFLARALLAMVPLLLPYFVVGWSSHSSMFKPVQAIHSVVENDGSNDEQADSSTEFRHMENFNLIETWKPNPFLGSGFGHEYDEVIQLPDISKFFPAYRYVPHNSVLWLLGIGGVLGFTALWLFLVVGLFLTARAYRYARVPEDRAAALTCICVAVCVLNQAFGDMGTQSWVSVFMLAPAVVLGGKLAVSVGAWPRAAPRARPVWAHWRAFPFQLRGVR
jgi:hypothetical protein